MVYAMQPELLIHVETKFAVTTALRRDIAERALPCQALIDGMAVRIDSATVFEPDVLVRCGPRLPGDTLLVLDPLIVIEIASPSTQRIDATMKLMRYFRNPAILHYLILSPSAKTAIHHHRLADGQILSQLQETGLVRIDPPGVELDLGEVWAAG